MDFAKFRPRGGTKAQWETANPVLGKREMGIQWESEIGVGKVVIKFGNGVTAWNNLDTAVEVENDLVNKIISSIVTVSDEYPILNDGDSLSTLVGKIKKYIQDLKDKKLDKSARYDGTDSTSTELVPTANALRGVNAKADKNASDITTLNNNLSKAVYTDDIFITTERPTFVYWNGNTKNTPFKAGLTTCQEGFAFSYGAWADYMTVVCFVKNDSTMWIWSKSRNAWVEYAAKSDLFANNYQTDPNSVTTPFAAINGFSNAVINVPDDAKNTWNSLQTIWLFPNEIGDLTKNRLQIIITGNNTTHRRMFENNKFSNWS